MMRWGVAEAVGDLIDRFGLHDEGVPVDLSPLKEEFVPLVEPIAEMGVRAFAVPPKGGVVSLDSPACVVLDEEQPEALRRLYYAHEIGHVLCEHEGSLRTLAVNDWFHDRQEREAWEVASVLLIPTAQMVGRTAAEVARACGVPTWLAEMYPRWW